MKAAMSSPQSAQRGFMSRLAGCSVQPVMGFLSGHLRSETRLPSGRNPRCRSGDTFDGRRGRGDAVAVGLLGWGVSASS